MVLNNYSILIAEATLFNILFVIFFFSSYSGLLEA